MKRGLLAISVPVILAAPPAPADEGPAFVVVAPRDLHGALAPFVEHKSARLPTELVALEDALAREGVDDPERLKRYLYERWSGAGHALRYVLLVGDADRLPVRYMVLDRRVEEAFNYAFYPSDLYYADLARAGGSFDDWNARADGFHGAYVGEVRGEHNKADPINFDDVSYVPEVAVGRWPASTPEDVSAIAAKSIAHEVALESREGPPRAVLVASGGWIENRSAMDRAGSALRDRWTVDRLYFADDRRDDGTPPPDEASVLREIDEGADLLLHSGHGTDDSWHGAISVRSIGRMENADRLPVVFSAGCSTARFATLPPYEGYVDAQGVVHAGTNDGEVFDAPPPVPAPYQSGRYNPTGLGEQLLLAPERGAIAYIGCNTGSQPCGMTLLGGFVDAAGADPDARLGDCWVAALAHYHEAEHLATIEPTESWYPASIFFQGMKFMLFGDPSMPMP